MKVFACFDKRNGVLISASQSLAELQGSQQAVKEMCGMTGVPYLESNYQTIECELTPTQETVTKHSAYEGLRDMVNECQKTMGVTGVPCRGTLITCQQLGSFVETLVIRLKLDDTQREELCQTIRSVLG